VRLFKYPRFSRFADKEGITDNELLEIAEKLQRRNKMKYESDIAEMIHEKAMLEFQLGLLTEAEMREYDELCLPEEALQDAAAQGDTAHEAVNIERADLVTA
jgi:hypothetical protein